MGSIELNRKYGTIYARRDADKVVLTQGRNKVYLTEEDVQTVADSEPGDSFDLSGNTTAKRGEEAIVFSDLTNEVVIVDSDIDRVLDL